MYIRHDTYASLVIYDLMYADNLFKDYEIMSFVALSTSIHTIRQCGLSVYSIYLYLHLIWQYHHRSKRSPNIRTHFSTFDNYH